MVIIKNSIRAATIPIAFTSFLVFDGCKKEDNPVPDPVTKTDLLVGDWKVTEIGGYEYTGSESIFFKFQSAGDFEWCYENDTDTTYNNCYGGKWKWKDANEENIIMDQFSGSLSSFELEFDVVVLTETNLEGSVTSTYDDGGYAGSYTQAVKFIKVK
jgi:hypothetical protein